MILMNIFVNIDHTAGILDNNVDRNGKVSLLKFLTALLDDISDCLGNVTYTFGNCGEALEADCATLNCGEFL